MGLRGPMNHIPPMKLQSYWQNTMKCQRKTYHNGNQEARETVSYAVIACHQQTYPSCCEGHHFSMHTQTKSPAHIRNQLPWLEKLDIIGKLQRL
jgi:hypothetical protein